MIRLDVRRCGCNVAEKRVYEDCPRTVRSAMEVGSHGSGDKFVGDGSVSKGTPNQAGGRKE